MSKEYQTGYKDGFKDGFEAGRNEPKPPTVTYFPPMQTVSGSASTDTQCMHKNCPQCRMGTCSGVHMISCPCKNCSPRMTS